MDFSILDPAEEDVLSELISKSESYKNLYVFIVEKIEEMRGHYDQYVRDIKTLLKRQYLIGDAPEGTCQIPVIIEISRSGKRYFEDKKAYLKENAERTKANFSQVFNINNMVDSNFVLGNQTINIDNSIENIAAKINEKGGEETEALMKLLEEAKALTDNILASKQIPRSEDFVKRLSSHLAKHGWFYQSIINLIGTAAIMKMQSPV